MGTEAVTPAVTLYTHNLGLCERGKKKIIPFKHLIEDSIVICVHWRVK